MRTLGEQRMPRLKTPGGLLGSVEAARFLEVHRSTLASWRRRGVLTPSLVEEGPNGRPRFKFNEEELEKLRERIDYDV